MIKSLTNQYTKQSKMVTHQVDVKRFKRMAKRGTLRRWNLISTSKIQWVTGKRGNWFQRNLISSNLRTSNKNECEDRKGKAFREHCDKLWV